MRRRAGTTLRLAGCALLASASLGIVAGAAGAHVEIEPTRAKAGSTTAIVFSPLNEEDDAGTTKVEVLFPRAFPVASAQVATADGWEAEVTTRRVRKPITGPDGKKTRTAVEKITWTGGPSPTSGSFDLPAATIGPLPSNTKQLVFKVVQTYANGHVDRWIEKSVPGTPEPEFPAPVLRVVKR